MKHDHRIYVDKLLELYLGLPDTPSRTSRYDRRLAYELHQQNVSLEIVEAALLLGSARRIFRDPSYPPSGTYSFAALLPTAHPRGHRDSTS